MDCVTVRLAGEFGASSQQLPSARLTLGSRKARRLLMVLAAQRDQLVPTDRIVDALWPDRPPQRLENLATLVSRLRASLGASCIIGGRDGYRLGTPPAVSVDLDEASRFVAEASRRLSSAEPGLAWTAATKALEMLGAGGILVDEPDADWLLATRAEGQQLLRSARHLAATAALLIEDPQAARALAEAAIGTDRFDEAAHRLLMKAHMAAGESANALTAYERLRAELADELGVDPSPQTRDVHLAVLREQQPGQAVEGQDPAIPNPKRVELPGRAAELARLLAGWAAAACGRPELLLLVGEAGIGKTRLAAEAVAEARSTGGLILQARCYPTERSLLLQPFVDALSGQLSSMRTDRLRELAGVRAGALVKLLPELAA
ncbi:MAG: BTAD domain-containing putative transcriptional regulator [Pseudonocardiales bacterium]